MASAEEAAPGGTSPAARASRHFKASSTIAEFGIQVQRLAQRSDGQLQEVCRQTSRLVQQGDVPNQVVRELL